MMHCDTNASYPGMPFLDVVQAAHLLPWSYTVCEQEVAAGSIFLHKTKMTSWESPFQQRGSFHYLFVGLEEENLASPFAQPCFWGNRDKNVDQKRIEKVKVKVPLIVTCRM